LVYKSTILKILNIKEEESKPVFWIIVYSFFLGASLAYFFTGTTSLFLNIFEREMISYAFIIAGFIVIITGQIYSYLQRKYVFSMSMIGGLGFLLISVIVFFVLFSLSKSVILIFILYAWNRVYAYIHNVVFWGMAGKLFSLQQAKRVFGLISGGEVIGLMIAFFSVPLLLKFISTEDLLFIATLFLLIGFIVLFSIAKKFKSKFSQVQIINKSNRKSDKTKKIGLFSNRYFKLFSLIAFLPVFAQFFVDFIFQAQAKIEFPEKETLTAFVGIFFGASAVFEFFLKTFLSGRLLSRYGIKFGLIIFPIVLGFSFILASTVGIIYGAVSIFFSFITLGRMFARSIRTSFNDPATQILYQPLPEEERAAFQNKIESGPKAFASILAGIILWIFTKIPGFTLVYFAVFLLIIIIIWYKVADNLYIEYKKKLQEVLTQKSTIKKKGKLEIIVDLIKDKLFFAKDEFKNTLTQLYKNIFPFTYNKEIGIQQIERDNYKLGEVVKMSYSDNAEERELAAYLFAEYDVFRIERPMISLLNDDNYDVRSQALISAGKMRERDFFKYLFQNLKTKQYREITHKAMLYVGNIIFTDLSKFFYKLEEEPNLQIKIIEIIEDIGGEKAIGFLRKKINYPNKQLRDRIIMALGNLNYKATKFEAPHISQKLIEEVRNYVYSAASIIDFKKISKDDSIIKAVENEMAEKKEKIFILLSVIYDAVAMQLIFENLKSEDPDKQSFALEIADTVINDIHKQLLLPIFENSTNKEIIRKYKFDSPQESLDITDRLIDIINSDVATTGFFTKATAVSLLINYPISETASTLKSCIIHPNKMISEVAAMVLYEKNIDLFNEQIQTNLKKHKHLKLLADKVQIKNNRNNLLILEKLELIKNIELFRNLKASNIIEIAENSYEEILQQNEKLIISKNNKDEIFIVVSGFLKNKNKNLEIEAGRILSIYDINTNDKEIIYEAEEISLLFKTKLFYFHDLFSNNTSFAEKYLETLN